MLAITVLLLAIGALLAALGTAGFSLVYFQPGSGAELNFARKAATVGRWLTAPGLLLYIAHYGASGPALGGLLLAAMLIPATLVTKTANRPATTTGVAR